MLYLIRLKVKTFKGFKMIKILIPEIKGKIKTNVMGLWLNSEHKLFYDYLKVINYNQSISGLYYEGLFYNYLDTLKTTLKQEAIFYVKDNIGYCYYSRDNIEVLNRHSIIEIKRQGKNTKLLRDYIRSALRLYNGITISIKGHSYILEVYYN